MTEKEGIYIDGDTLKGLYHMHRDSFLDLMNIESMGADKYDECWLDNPSEIEHRSVFETTYHANRSFLCLIGAE